jgi:putative ABC transport system permease protein
VSVFATLWLAVRALGRNKGRTLLTMLGIIFGIGAVIAMVSSGEGMQDAVREVFNGLGTNMLIVTNGSVASFGAAGGAGSRSSLTWDDLVALQDPAQVPSAQWVAPQLSTKAQIASDDANWNTSVNGTTALWFDIRNWTVAKGELFDDESGNTKVAVIGQTVATQLFGENDPIGQTIRISNMPFQVIGVLSVKGQGPMGDNDDIVVIPVKAYLQKMERGLAKYLKGQVLVSSNSEKDIDETISEITAVLRDRHKLDSSQDDDFRIRNPSEFAQAQLASNDKIRTLLAVVAAVSLLIGGIGVMNIMLVSVIERTREIGIRMAVGAKPFDVALQFLVEALVLAAFGGLIGLALGAGGALWMAGHYGWKFFFPTGTAVIAFAVSGGVGVVFGLYPAIRASRLDPITALRYES